LQRRYKSELKTYLAWKVVGGGRAIWQKCWRPFSTQWLKINHAPLSVPFLFRKSIRYAFVEVIYLLSIILYLKANVNRSF